MGVNLLLVFGSGQITIVIGITCIFIYVNDILEVEEVEDFQIDIKEASLGGFALVILLEAEHEGFVDTEVALEDPRHVGTVDRTGKLALGTADIDG